MRTTVYHSMQKTNWPYGTWQTEPDKIQWTDGETNLPCLIVRSHTTGSLCGYVGVPPKHPLYQVHYSQVLATHDINVHGGLTFSDFCQKGDECNTICHTPDYGEEDKVWWFGFDCSHYGDIAPKYLENWEEGVYRDVKYVRQQVLSLAKQLDKIGKVG